MSFQRYPENAHSALHSRRLVSGPTKTSACRSHAGVVGPDGVLHGHEQTSDGHEAEDGPRDALDGKDDMTLLSAAAERELRPSILNIRKFVRPSMLEGRKRCLQS